MYMPGPDQAVWRYDLISDHLERVPGTEGALGVVVGTGGRLLWPLVANEGKSASLWTAQQGQAVSVVNRVDMAHFYYGQFYWDQVFDWWHPHGR